MAQLLPWVALAISGLIVAHAALRSGSSPRAPGLGAVLGTAAAALLIGAALTLPAGSPWSSGQGLWPGYLLGGSGVLLAAAVIRFGPGETALAAGARIAAAVIPAAVLLLLYPSLKHALLDTLGGMALGALVVGIVLSAAEFLGDSAASEGAQHAALTSVALTTAIYLAADHRNELGIRDWMPLPVLLAATGAAGLTVRGLLGGSSLLLSIAVVIAPVLLMAWLIGYRLEGSPPFFSAVLVGLAVYAAVVWLERADEEERPGLRPEMGLLAALLLLGGAALAFRERQGYGVALAALAGCITWGAAGDRRSALLPGGVALLLLVSLYRVFTESTGYERGFQPEFLYFYVALIAGALLPALLAASAFRGAPAAAVPALARALLAGGAAVLAPLALWLLVGERPQAAMLVGLAVGAGFLLSRPVMGARAPSETSVAGLLALVAGWTAVQFTHLLNPLALGTRMQRVTVLAAVGVIALAAVAGAALLERSKTPPQPAAAE